MEFFSQIESALNSASPLTIALFIIAFLAIWFLPAILALFFNRKHFMLILAACVPAGFSIIAWCGLMIWATTGKGIEKFVKNRKLKEQAE
ncbi:superinfection immunity protein [Psychrobium sp. 1_MG-2023]|uniref:superinfection immunity protein n=1 Tax=Psychrobium sp. 1_MG-2023 TaxID=3062624 RepID=UPI000C3426D8|nr:superinfection immunity protein [Psychrobium sp. 1_MG-2023]MDP2562746.1 superinfection immunity protein [Psychrobium sp. 1_MG-2023]PKF54169.1 hypothetical protein CW748_17095 [Alteromonadales bacterium alter-6D02]